MNRITLNSSEIFVEGLRVTSRPLDADMGVLPLTPFVVSVSAETSNYEDLNLALYANNSKSIPYTSELDNNWNALKPQWRFLDVDGNILEDDIAIDYHTEVSRMAEDGSITVVGGVGTATFYYKDDMPSDCGSPVMLYATLNLTNYHDREHRVGDSEIISYYNSSIQGIIPFQIYNIKPSFLHFSQNGTVELYSKQWAGNTINSYATIHGTPRTKFLDYNQCSIDYPILFNVPKYDSVGGTNILDYTIFPLLPSEMSLSAETGVEFPKHELSSGVADGGFVEVGVTGLVESQNAVVSGAVDVVYDLEDYACRQTSEIWVSNRTANKLHKLQGTYIDFTNPAMDAIFQTSNGNIISNMYSTGFDVPFYDPLYYDDVVNEDVLSNIHELSGYSGIYGIGIDGSDNVWNLDFELDRIYKRNSAGGVLFTIDLQKLNLANAVPSYYTDDEYTWYGPNAVSIDLVGNAYVTMYNSPYIMKILQDGTIDSYMIQSEALAFSLDPMSGDENYLYRNTDIETDTNGGIHVMHSNNSNSGLVHFDSNGVQDAMWHTSDVDRPFDMVYMRDIDDILYMSCKGREPVNTPTRGVYKFTLVDGAPSYSLVRLNLCERPTYITIDKENAIWFAFDNNKIGYLPAGTTTNQSTNFNSFEIPTNTPDDLVIGGICCDDSGYINIIQTYTNIIYRLNSQDYKQTGTFNTLPGIKMNPEYNYTIIQGPDDEITFVDATSGQEVASLQAYGDWSGAIWDHKFAESNVLIGSETVSLDGGSSNFEIQSFNENYDIRRQNDSWDMHKQIKSYIIPDYQQEFTDLWDDLIGNIVGNDESGYQTFGRQFYEKISNFVLNHSDIDFANINQVYSIFESLSLEYQNYNFDYPAELGHWMNILSITLEKLKGSQYPCNRNFIPKRYEERDACEVCGQIHTSNMGDEVITPVMVVGEPVIIRDTYLSENAFDIFYPPLAGDFQQLSDHYGYRTPFVTNYEVYEYIEDVSINEQSEGFINWDDDNNDFAISGYSNDDWWKDGGVVEDIFTQVLYTGLGYKIDYYTQEQAENEFELNIIGALTTDNTDIITSGSVLSEYIIPVKNSACSPIAGYGIPFYTSSEVLNGSEIPLGYPVEGIVDGLAVANLYLEIPIGDETYYAPSYIIDRQVIPVVGTGITFDRGFTAPPYSLTSSGFLSFENDGQKILLPVYK